MSEALDRFNALDDEQAIGQLMRCCGSKCWARQMIADRPFATFEDVIRRADKMMDTLEREDWVEAFGHHPQIGGDDIDRRRFESTRNWSRDEQSGVAGAEADVRQRLAEGNQAYWERFGWVFLICATGKTAQEMAEQLDRRLGNDLETELAEAAGQQRLITRLRLERLLNT